MAQREEFFVLVQEDKLERSLIKNTLFLLLTVCSFTHLRFSCCTNRRWNTWKCTGGPPNDVKPRSHVLLKTVINRLRSGSALMLTGMSTMLAVLRKYVCKSLFVVMLLRAIPSTCYPRDGTTEGQASCIDVKYNRPEIGRVSFSDQGIHWSQHSGYELRV